MGDFRRGNIGLIVFALKCGGDGGIRTLDTRFSTYNALAKRRLQPLGHVSPSAASANRIVGALCNSKPSATTDWHITHQNAQISTIHLLKRSADDAFDRYEWA
jgi:hypothetical protein